MNAHRSRDNDRTVVRAGLRGEATGLMVVGGMVTLAVITGLAGQLAAIVTGAGWPSWHGLGTDLLRPIIGVYAHPGSPMRDWPNLAHRPAALIYWPIFVVLLAAVIAPVVLAVRLMVGGRSRPGFASRRQVEAKLGAKALLAQAPRLRPQLARSTPRPRPEQLGSSLGRDVHTGVDCYSSVRQSKYVVGPSESGKTSAVVIPEALDHDGPLLAPSSRADVMAATWRARADRGRVLLFDPLHQVPVLPPLR